MEYDGRYRIFWWWKFTIFFVCIGVGVYCLTLVSNEMWRKKTCALATHHGLYVVVCCFVINFGIVFIFRLVLTSMFSCSCTHTKFQCMRLIDSWTYVHIRPVLFVFKVSYENSMLHHFNPLKPILKMKKMPEHVFEIFLLFWIWSPTKI